jgi:TolA-binding protein
MTTCVLACLATLACALGAGAQSDPAIPVPPPEQAQEEQRLEAERRQLEAQQRRLEQQRTQIEQQARRAREQAEQQGRRAREQVERGMIRAREQAQRQFDQARRGFGGMMAPGGLPAPFGGQPDQPQGNFERELLRAHGLDTGPGDGGGAMAAFLGVSTTPVPPAVRRRVDLPDGIGLVIGNVEPNSPAQQAGLKQYDILHKLNDQLLVNAEQLAVLVRTFKPGDAITLTIVRGGKMEQVPARLGERPAGPLPQTGGGGGYIAPQQVQPPQPPQTAPRGMFWPGQPMQPPQRFRLQSPQPGVTPPHPVPRPPAPRGLAPAWIFAQPAPAPTAVPVPSTPQIHVVPIAPVAPAALPATPTPAQIDC